MQCGMAARYRSDQSAFLHGAFEIPKDPELRENRNR